MTLIGVGALTAVGFASVYIARQSSISAASLSYAGVFLGLYLLAHLVARATVPYADPYLLPIAGLLTAVGITEIYRLDPTDAFRQGMWVVIGVALFALTLFLLRHDYRKLESYRYLFGVGAVALLALPAVPGIGATINGARLWVKLGPLQFQPGEIAKICLIIFLAGYLREKREVLAQGRLKDFGPLLVIWGCAMLVLVETKDLGSALLFFGIFLVMLYVATSRLLYVAIGAGLFLAGATVAYETVSRVRERVTIWLHPWTEQAVYCAANGKMELRRELRELPADEVAVLDRERRLYGDRAREGDIHDHGRRRADSVPEHRLHLLRARAGARPDRHLRARPRLHALRDARVPHRAPRQ